MSGYTRRNWPSAQRQRYGGWHSLRGKACFVYCVKTWLSESTKQVCCVEQNPSNPVEACHIKGTCWHTLILSESPWKEKATTPRRNLQGDAAKNLIFSNATRWRKVLWWWRAGKGIYHLLLRSKRVDGKQQSITTSYTPRSLGGKWDWNFWT